MLSRVHSKLGTAGLVVAIVALVAALTGVAFAAGGLTKKQEKQVIKIAKKYAGKDGATGPAGPQGPKGDAGPKGDQGPEGKQGPEGQQGPKGNTGEAGMCSQAEPECSLASNATLTGVWSFRFNGSAQQAVPYLSFPVRVEPAPTEAVLIGQNENNLPGVSFNPATGEGVTVLESAQVQALCPGSAAVPSAAPGVVCIYGKTFKNAEMDIFGLFANPAWGASPDPSSGALFSVTSRSDESTGFASGSWAVTAE